MPLEPRGEASVLDLEAGAVVAGRYRINRPLGRGGMGEVFAAENIHTGRPVALKLLRQDSKTKASAVARFRLEARAAGKINSDHVTQVLDVMEDDEHGVVLVFELLEGESLIDRLKRTGPIPFEELWPIIEQVWMGLADAHRAGIIHRDLKPSNVFLERRPDGSMRVKILDFGISKVPKEVGGETLTEMGQSLGTFSFMPPEQIGKAKTVDHRADIYACTTLIFQSLTAQLPYAARNILLLVEAKSKTDPRKLSDAMTGAVDPQLEAFVSRGLSRDPAQRFQTALDALGAWRDLRPQAGVASNPHGGAASGPTPRTPAEPSSGPPASSGVRPARVQSQSTVAGTGPPSPHLPPPRIVESSGPLPRVGDLVEMTTDETAATLAMPMPHLKKAQPLQATPPLAPRVDAAAASIGAGPIPGHLSSLQLQPSAPKPALAAAPAKPAAAAPVHAHSAPPVGPGGTQPVVVGRALNHLRPRQDDASVDRRKAATPPGTGPSGLPRTYEEPAGPADGEGRTQVYRPKTAVTTGSPAGAPRPPSPPPAPARRQVPLPLLLLGFLVVGFAVVAGAMVLFRR